MNGLSAQCHLLDSVQHLPSQGTSALLVPSAWNTFPLALHLLQSFLSVKPQLQCHLGTLPQASHTPPQTFLPNRHLHQRHFLENIKYMIKWMSNRLLFSSAAEMLGFAIATKVTVTIPVFLIVFIWESAFSKSNSSQPSKWHEKTALLLSSWQGAIWLLWTAQRSNSCCSRDFI